MGRAGSGTARPDKNAKSPFDRFPAKRHGNLLKKEPGRRSDEETTRERRVGE